MTPELSVVIVTPDSFETIRRAVKHWRAQTIRDQIELVIVAPDDMAVDADVRQDFLRVCVVAVGTITSTARARAAGIRAASAPVVMLAEDHAFQNPSWAEAIIKAHRHPYAAVGPAMLNANPRRLVSCANLLSEYSEWLAHPGGVVTHLPGHNSAYKRDLLLGFGDALEPLLEAEIVLQQKLMARGFQLYLEPAAKTYHLNFTSMLTSLPLRFNGGRLFASARARDWTASHRLVYFFGASLIPWVRVWRIAKWARRSETTRAMFTRALPLLLFLLGVDALGEAFGYAFGGGSAMRQIAAMEFHRERYLDPDEPIKIE